jgi:hypothetical protein
MLVVPTLLLACSSEPPGRAAELPAADTTTSAEPDPALLTADGWGPLRIGMSRAQVVQAAGEDAQPNAVGGADPEACDQFRPRQAPAGLLVMIENGVLTRISVSRNSDLATAEGIRVGDRGATVLARYGARAQVLPHKYLEAPARYITVWRTAHSDPARRGIRFETDAEDRVAHIHVGGPSIEYVEGCL